MKKYIFASIIFCVALTTIIVWIALDPPWPHRSRKITSVHPDDCYYFYANPGSINSLTDDNKKVVKSACGYKFNQN